MPELLYPDLTYTLRGIAFKIHNELRGGHEESVYEAAMALVMETSGISFQRQPVYRISYRDQQVGEYRPDFMLQNGQVLAELKATPKVVGVHKAQTISYLGVTKAELALLINFGGSSVQIERFPNFLGQRKVEEYSPPLPGDVEHLYPELTRRVLDALGHVHRTFGAGFLHQVYRRSARIELTHRQIGFRYITELPIRYNGHILGARSTRLLHVEERLLVATVALQEMNTVETERLRWAMKMTGAQLGLIVNFYGTRLQPEFIRTL